MLNLERYHKQLPHTFLEMGIFFNGDALLGCKRLDLYAEEHYNVIFCIPGYVMKDFLNVMFTYTINPISHTTLF